MMYFALTMYQKCHFAGHSTIYGSYVLRVLQQKFHAVYDGIHMCCICCRSARSVGAKIHEQIASRQSGSHQRQLVSNCACLFCRLQHVVFTHGLEFRAGFEVAVNFRMCRMYLLPYFHTTIYVCIYISIDVAQFFFKFGLGILE